MKNYKLPKNFKKEIDKITFQHIFDIELNKMVKKLMEDPLIKKIVKELNEKEAKKMKYFETKVVKVKKKYKDVGNEYRLGDTFKCSKCGELFIPIPKQKGNWVNGENLDKIKFPCFCSYRDNDYQHRCYGIMIKNQGDYKIVPLQKQYRILSYPFSEDLAYFIKNWNIHILKGKIILYEEE